MNGIYVEPALLEPQFFPYIWGGVLLRSRLGKNIPSDDIGESWEVSAHARGQSVVASGPARGMPFGSFAVGPEFYGDAPFERFPLLIKFLGASGNLSVQVHPGDGNCRSFECGKAEAWVVISAEPGAEIIFDINCSAEEFALAVMEGRVEQKLRRIKVSVGDVLDIPPGTVHALTAGIVVYEVQQHSDTTYRLYDWGRVDAKTGKPRELHIEDALRVIRPAVAQSASPSSALLGKDYGRTLLVHNPHFTLERIDMKGSYTDDWFNSFAAYSVIDGGGEVLKDNQKCFDVKLGDSFVSPAAAGPVQLRGKMALLKAYVPPG